MEKKYSKTAASNFEKKIKELKKTNKSLLPQITKRKHIENKLKESGDKYRPLHEQSPIIKIVISIDGIIKNINNTIIKKLGFSKNEIIGKNALDFIVSKQREKVAAQIRRYFEGEFAPEIEVDIYAKDRSIHTLSFSSGNLSLKEKEQPDKVLITGIDVTEYKKMEQALKESEDKLRSFIDSSSIGIWCFRLNNPIDITLSDEKMLDEFFKSKCVECNDTYATMMGTTKDEILGTVLNEVMLDTEENREYLKKFIHNNFKISGGISHEICKNGLDKYFSNSMTATIKNEKLIEAWGTQTDITELKRSEEELKAINEELMMLSQTVKSMRECVSITNKEHKIIFVNEAFLELYGFNENEILGKTSSLIFSPSNPKNLKEKIRSSTMKDSWKGELLNVKKNGTEFPIVLSTSILKDNKGNAIAYIGISSDITERKRAEERIEHLNKIILAIRNVNQLITKEKDKDNLIKKACSLLVETSGYFTSWIVLLDKSGKVILNTNSGFGKFSSQVLEFFKSGKLPACGRKALEQSDIVITEAKGSICAECPVLNLHSNEKTLTTQLKYGSNIYGLISASVPMISVKGTQEESLFKDVAGDIAFALYDIEMEKERKKLEELESSILHSVPYAVVGLHERQITFANESVKDVFGWEAEELIGKNTRILYRSDKEYNEIAEHLYPALEKQQTHYEEFPCRRKDGKDIICMVRASRIGEKLKEGETVTTYIDITERKRYEIIQKSLYQIATSVHTTKSMGELSRIIQLELGKILDTANFFITLYNKEDNTISLPYLADEKDKFETFPIGKTFTAYVIKSGKPLLAKKEQIKELIQSGEVEVVGTLSKVWLGVPLKVENDIVGALVVQSYTDENAYNEKDLELLEFVSSQIGLSIEHKRSDEKVLESEEKYRLLVENVNDGIVISQRDKFIFFNKQFSEMLGYTYDELFMKDYQDVYTEKNVEILMERKRLRDRGEYVPSRYETVFKKKDGTTIEVEANVTIIDYKGDKATFAVIRDITERKKSEKTLRDSEANFRSLAQNAFDCIAINNEDGDYVYVNKRSAELTGYSIKELLKLNLKDLTPRCDTEKVLNRSKRRIKGKPIENFFESTLLRKDGVELPIEVTATRTIWQEKPADMVFFRDITDRKILEKETLKVQKLESTGILAGGIAHDFNNILTVILGNITLIKMHAKPEDKVYDRLLRAEKASMRAKDLTQRLLTFSKGGAPVKENSSIVNLVKESANFALTGSNVACKFSIPDDIWHVEIDKGQINQVINNLVINADQAMPEGGTILIIAENIKIGEDNTLLLKAGNYVKITVEDQGIGIPEKHLNKIFDPYFTTKTIGSGLGLATTYSIIKNHGGLITVDSELGVGSKFFIYLPASLKKAVEKEEKEEKPLTGKGRVLIMDDDELLREVAGDIIKQLGYETEFAKDGNEAIDLYKNAMDSSRTFDVVIMDLTIPGGMGGKIAVKELLKIDPDAKAIVSSGYSNDPIISEFEKYGFVGVVAKPYKVEEMGKILHKVVMESKE